MENLKLVEKLKNKANISYEEAKDVLEKSNGDILDAMLYLEEKDKIKRPSVSIFYTNENKETYKEIEVIYDNEKRNYNKNTNKKNNSFDGVFEVVCKLIDTCNNIFLEIKKADRVFIKVPITVMILLLIFAFWMVIPLAIVGLFFDIEFSLLGREIGISKANNIFKMLSKNVKRLKEGLKRGFKNG